MAVLRVLADEGAPLRLADVQRKTGLQKTVVFRLLRTLAASRFVEQDPETGHFHIGIGAFEIAQAYPRGASLIALARPALRRLVEGSPHTAYLATLDGFEIVYLTSAEGVGPLRVHVEPGYRNPAYATAVGKALLAELSDTEITGLARTFGFARLTATTITSARELVRQVREVREQGYALNDEEAYPGIGGIGTVVRDGSGTVRAGLSLSYATSLLGPAELPAWVERSTATALEITAMLGSAGAEGLVA